MKVPAFSGLTPVLSSCQTAIRIHITFGLIETGILEEFLHLKRYMAGKLH